MCGRVCVQLHASPEGICITISLTQKKRKEKAIKNYSNKKNRDKTAYLRYITKTIKKTNVSMHELSSAESVTCSQEKLQYLLVQLKSILDILVELSEDPGEVLALTKFIRNKNLELPSLGITFCVTEILFKEISLHKVNLSHTQRIIKYLSPVHQFFK